MLTIVGGSTWIDCACAKGVCRSRDLEFTSEKLIIFERVAKNPESPSWPISTVCRNKNTSLSISRAIS